MEEGEFSGKTEKNKWFSQLLGTLGNFSIMFDEMQEKNETQKSP